MSAPRALRDLFRSTRILWQNRSGFYCLGLDGFCPVEAVISLDSGREYGLIERQTGIRMLGVESVTRTRGKPSETAIETVVPALRPRILELLDGRRDGSWALVCPLPSTAFESLARELGIKSACHPVALCAWLNQKANLFAGLDALGLPRLPGRWLRLSEAPYAEICASVGSKLVIQQEAGSGGSGTLFVRSPRDFAEAGRLAGDQVVWVAPELQGPSLNVNAIALERSVVVGPPSVQLVGIAALGARAGTYCGNDFTSAAALGAGVLDDAREQTLRIGGWLSTLGYRGLFGVDFQLEPASGSLLAVDLNPRWQGSTAISTQAEALAGRLPLAVAEVAWKLGALGEDEIARQAGLFFAPVQASQMSLRSGVRDWRVVAGDVAPGVYSCRPRIEPRRPGIRLDDLEGPDEVLVTGGVPAPGSRVAPRATFLRVYSRHATMDPARGSLLGWSERFAAAMYAALRLDPATG